MVEGCGLTTNLERPGSPRWAVASGTRFEKVSRVRHLVQQRVSPLGAIALEHQVAIECDLDDMT